MPMPTEHNHPCFTKRRGMCPTHTLSDAIYQGLGFWLPALPDPHDAPGKLIWHDRSKRAWVYGQRFGYWGWSLVRTKNGRFLGTATQENALNRTVAAQVRRDADSIRHHPERDQLIARFEYAPDYTGPLVLAEIERQDSEALCAH